MPEFLVFFWIWKIFDISKYVNLTFFICLFWWHLSPFYFFLQMLNRLHQRIILLIFGATIILTYNFDSCHFEFKNCQRRNVTLNASLRFQNYSLTSPRAFDLNPFDIWHLSLTWDKYTLKFHTVHSKKSTNNIIFLFSF